MADSDHSERADFVQKKDSPTNDSQVCDEAESEWDRIESDSVLDKKMSRWLQKETHEGCS